MPERFFGPLSEATLAIVTFVVTTASHLLLYDSDEQAREALRWLLLPLIGSLLAAGGVILFNPRPEHRKIVFGRSIFAVVFGTAVPKLTSLMHPWLQHFYVEPAAILLSGFVVAMVVFVLSKPFVQKFYARSDRMADEGLDNLEARFRQSVQQDKTPNKEKDNHEN